MTEDQLVSSIEHVHGPEDVSYAEDELVLVCLVRDGRPYLKSFFEHYSSLGVKHMFFLENNSSDGTLEALRRYENVTVLQTTLSHTGDGEPRVPLKRYLINRFGKRDRWCLYVDIDELFDYPYSDVVSLASLLRYLMSKSYTAVAAQMLEMFPKQPLTNRKGKPDEPLKELHRFYDLSNLKRYNMKNHLAFRKRNNTLESDDIDVFQGGILNTLFGTTNFRTKFPLVFSDGIVKPMDDSSHWVDNTKIADLTCVLFHYKFLDQRFREQAVQAAREGHRWRDSAVYRRYLQVLDENPVLHVMQETSKEIESVNDLLDDLLVVSKDYVSWVDAEEERTALPILQSAPSHELARALLESRRRERAKSLNMRMKVQGLQRQFSHIWLLRQRLAQQARHMERQLESIQASRVWRLMSMLERVKALVTKRQAS